MLKNKLIKRQAKNEDLRMRHTTVKHGPCQKVTRTNWGERKILWKIYLAESNRRYLENKEKKELNALIEGKYIGRFIKAQRTSWLGTLREWRIQKIVNSVWKGKRHGKRRRKRQPKNGWMASIEILPRCLQEARQYWWMMEGSGGVSLRKPRPTRGCRVRKKKDTFINEQNHYKTVR